MNRQLSLSRVAAQTLVATLVALTLGAAADVAAQSAGTAADDSTAATTPADQPRRGRDRRRDASTASERPPAEAATAATPAAIADSDDTVEGTVVCKNIKLTGSKVARRICGTPEQWAAMQKRTNRAAEETMRQARDRQSTITRPPTEALSSGN